MGLSQLYRIYLVLMIVRTVRRVATLLRVWVVA